MPRYSARESFGDGEYAYDDRYDAGEYTTYGQSRGPTSNAYSDGTAHDGNTSSRRSYQPAYDRYGYPYEGSYAGEEDLRRRAARLARDESTFRTDPRERLGRDSQYSYNADRRSRLSEQTSAADDREYRDARRQEHIMRQEQERRSRRREASPDPGPRRGTFSSYNDSSSSYQRQAREEAREQQMREYDDLPKNVRKYGRGYFPAYDYC